MITLSKTDYILFRECPNNVWYKIHQPDIYFASELSDFEKHIIETGNEVELVARELFPDGVLIEGRGEDARKLTEKYIAEKKPAIFQPVFANSGFFAAVDVLRYDEEKDGWKIYEIKASNEPDKKRHYYDLAFQVVLLRKCGVKISSINLLHLNGDYVREDKLDITSLFKIDDLTDEINKLSEEVALEMEQARDYLSADKLPPGSCVCIYKGRSAQCTTFRHSNPKVPEYGVHDISRIGNSKKKLAELVDIGNFHLDEVPEGLELSASQWNQINAYVSGKVLMDKEGIKEELSKIKYPLYFIDYETFPSAIPLFSGFSPYQQIPFQYALYVLRSPGSEPEFFEFLYSEAGDPSHAFAESLQKNIGTTGSVIVWSKKFETMINKQLAERLPEFSQFIGSLNKRVYDLMDVFTNQHYVHKDFKGKTSIKNILPVMAPEFSYKDLAIRDGGMAASSWFKLTAGGLSEAEKSKLKKDMLEYCKTDSFAMVRILQELQKQIA